MSSIEKRGNNSWRLVVEIGYDAAGKRIKRYKTVKVDDPSLLRTTKRLKEFLNDELLKFKIEVEAGEYIAPEKMTFVAFVQEWRTKYAERHLAEKTLILYESHLKNRILLQFGHMRLDQIKPLHILEFLETLSRKGDRMGFRKGKVSSGTIEVVHRVLKNIFTRAVEWKLLKENPVAKIKKPRVKHKEVRPYDEQEIKLLLIALQQAPIHWRVIITLALITGLRRGELLGLEWHHIDWETGVISVEQSVTFSPGGEAHVKEPKTKGSRRKVAIPPAMLKELQEYRSYKMDEFEKIGDRWQGNVRYFVFSHPDGKAFHQKRPYLWFRDFLKKKRASLYSVSRSSAHFGYVSDQSSHTC